MGLLFRLCFLLTLAALGVGLAGQTTDPAKADAELERIRALVNAGALPRRALPEAEQSLKKARLSETLRKTLTKRDLTETELPGMLAAARSLRDMARDQLALTRGRVEAGAIPIKQLEIDKEAADAADRQYELAETRARLVRELSSMARAESRLDELEDEELAFVSTGGDPFWDDDIAAVNQAFWEAFGVPLPISADGYTALHESIGLDHTGRLDVPIHPDDAEGLFLVELLQAWDIPFIAFRSAVPGQSTGPHIHIGPRSERIPVGGQP
jgi:PAS domain-containing protein